MTEQDDRWVLPRQDEPDAWQYRRPGEVQEPPTEPTQEPRGQGSLDLPAKEGRFDVGDPPAASDIGEPLAIDR